MALAGALSLNARPGESPHPLAVQVADIGAGAQGAATAILGALLSVARGGDGRFLDVSMTDGALSWLAVPMAQLHAEGHPISRGMHRLTGRYACYRVYETADGRFFSVGALEPKFWQALCEVLGRPDLVPAQYAEGEEQDALHAEMEEIFAGRSRDDWEKALGGGELCCEPVLELEEVGRHPHIAARDLINVRPTGLEIAPAVPFLEDWRRRDAPGLGEHSAELLSEVGVDEARLGELRAAGVV
jgi:crotonobetainyl-CoA:carnitine CoA-transferase CaiB-like acyl-CoA transferase